MSKKIAVFPGSFAPFTIGHESIVNRALPLFDEVIIAVGSNSQKQEYFSLSERVQWIEDVFQKESKVSVRKYEGLTVDFCEKVGAQYILRGLRNSSDFKYEKGIAQMNRSMEGKIDTIFIITEPSVSHISSTLVRDIVKNGGDVSQFVPEGVTI
jgi:pantetheine-phosphate adenylyltransferase